MDVSEQRDLATQPPYLVAKFKIPKKNLAPDGELNLDEIKKVLHSLSVNRETNLMNLIRP